MLLALDLGNTNLVAGLFDGDQLVHQQRIETALIKQSVATLEEGLGKLNQAAEAAGKPIDGVALSSVVPDLTARVADAVRGRFGIAPVVIGVDDIDLGVGVDVDEPEEVGADRLMNAAAGFAKYGGSLLILDFGTATTIDVIDDKGAYTGGVIAPGINLSLKALADAAAQLPEIGFAAPDDGKVIGRTTLGAMQAGIFWGYVGLSEGLIRRVKDEYGAPMQVIATGGLAPLIAKATDMIDVVDGALTLDGLRIAFERSQQKPPAS